MRENAVRIIYILLCVVVVVIAVRFYPDVVAAQSQLNAFSYLGTVATLVGLIIAGSEVVHSIRVTKSLQQQTIQALADVRKVEDASSLSDCLAVVDLITNDVFQQRYDSAVTNFQHFRKLYAKLVPGTVSDELNEFGKIEWQLLKATKTRADAPLSKPQKNELLRLILLVKQRIEAANPARRS